MKESSVMSDRAESIRKQIMRLLQDEEMSAMDLSRRIGIGEKEVYDHLPKVNRSLTASGAKVEIIPSRCIGCGFIFAKRTRFTEPGRCPKCRGTHIQRPRFRVRGG